LFLGFKGFKCICFNPRGTLETGNASGACKNSTKDTNEICLLNLSQTIHFWILKDAIKKIIRG
jgi:hypothetical protein